MEYAVLYIHLATMMCMNVCCFILIPSFAKEDSFVV